MKFNKLTTAVAALAAAAVFVTSARAQVYPTYLSGQALIGFEQQGSSSDYVVDLGSVSQFIGAASPLTFQLSTTDLSTVFGSSWASNSQTNLVQWGIVANDQGQAISSDTDGDSIWYTKGETVAGTRTTAPIRGSSSALGSISNQIQNLETASTGGFVNILSTADTSNAVTEPSTSANSWTSFKPGTYSGGTAFGIGSEIEQPGSGSNTGPTDSVLDFFQVNSKTASNQAATFLGTFSLNSSGVLTFDEAQAVPEPSAYALGITGIILFLVLKRRKSISVAA